MVPERFFVITLVVLIGMMGMSRPGHSQVGQEKIISFTGVIEKVHEKFKFIVVNEARIVIASDTEIADESGNILKPTALRSKLHVSIEALRRPDGLLAKKIVVKARKKP